MLKKITLCLLILLLGSLTAVYAQEGLTATTLVDLNMRNQPSQSGSVITKLATGTTVVVEGRNDGETWLPSTRRIFGAGMDGDPVSAAERGGWHPRPAGHDDG